MLYTVPFIRYFLCWPDVNAYILVCIGLKWDNNICCPKNPATIAFFIVVVNHAPCVKSIVNLNIVVLIWLLVINKFFSIYQTNKYASYFPYKILNLILFVLQNIKDGMEIWRGNIKESRFLTLLQWKWNVNYNDFWKSFNFGVNRDRFKIFVCLCYYVCVNII